MDVAEAARPGAAWRRSGLPLRARWLRRGATTWRSGLRLRRAARPRCRRGRGGGVADTQGRPRTARRTRARAPHAPHPLRQAQAPAALGRRRRRRGGRRRAHAGAAATRRPTGRGRGDEAAEGGRDGPMSGRRSTAHARLLPATNTSPPRATGSAAQSERDRRVRGSRPNTAGGQARLRGAIHGLHPPPALPHARARHARARLSVMNERAFPVMTEHFASGGAASLTAALSPGGGARAPTHPQTPERGPRTTSATP